VIANGVDAERFAAAAAVTPAARAARARWRRRLGAGAAPVVLAVGGIEPRKGTVHLPGAIRRLRDAGRPVHLVIAGGETLFDYRDYRAAFDDACTRDGVVPLVLGPIAHDELPALVATADVFAFPSTHEGFGLAPLEALAAGVPTVMSDLPVLREVFDGVAQFAPGPLAPDGLATALLAALDHPDPDRRAAGRALARRHRWARAAQAHVELYERLAPRRAPALPSW
jgi:glycosyltransferase involved in cell wall biosynthesis